MTELTPQQISVSFVTQYYFILSSNTKNLFKFYKTESEMTHEHSTVVKQLPGNINPNAAVGVDNIEKKISTLGYEECKVKLTYVDSQRSLNGAVFVFVEGVMTRQVDQKEMNFTQTFLLAEQENGYFVRNDYLRFIPDTSNIPTTVQATQSNPPLAESSTTASVSSTSSSEHHSKSQNGHQLSFSLNPSTVNIVSSTTNGSHSPRSEASSTAATAGASSVYGGAEENQLDDEAEEEEITVVEKKPQQNQQPTQAKSTTSVPAENKEPHGTISYAAAASGRDYKNESSEQQQTQPKHKSGKKHNKENKEHKTEQHKTENKEHKTTTEQQQHNKEHKEHKEHKDHKEHKEHKDHKNEHHKNEHKKPATAPVTGEQKQVSAEKKEKTFRGKDHPLNKHAIYVRDLPVGTKDSDLKEAFAAYGSIIDINNKSGKDQSYNKYALIFFEKQQSVDEVLKNPAVSINNHQCPITKYQRKPKQYPRTPNQPTSTTTTSTPTKTETTTTPVTNNTQQPRNNNNNNRAPRQKYTRATSNESESEKK